MDRTYCTDCIYWVGTGRSNNGSCHKNPPTGVGIFPRTFGDMFCYSGLTQSQLLIEKE